MNKYKKNFLKGVLARIDFSIPIAEISDSLKTEFVQVIMKNFPLKETSKIIGQELQFAPQGVRSRGLQETEWLFHGKDREKTLHITKNALIIEHKTYDSFTNLKADFIKSVDALYLAYPDIIASRLGLRYVNNIDIDEANPLDWSEYLNNGLLCELNMSLDNDKISRFFSSLDFNFGDMNLRFQYGNHNPDYPAVIKRKFFVLDFDAYLEVFQEKKDIINNLDKFHEKVEEYFEKCITDKLREILNAK